MPKILTSTTNISRDEWLEFRKMGIGGSDAAAVVGLNPFKSQYSLYADKLRLLPTQEDTEIMRQGRDFEEYVAKRFCEATGKKVRRRNYMFQHDEHDFMLADIDREIIGENAGLECKTTSLFNKSDFENGEIPLYYYVQMMHYMAVMGYEKMYLAVLVLSKAFYWFEIKRDEDEIEALTASERRFWTENVLRHTPPPLDGSEATTEAVRVIYTPVPQGDFVETIPEDIMKEYEQAKEIADKAAERMQAIKNTISAAVGDSGRGESEAFKISWLAQSRTTIDSKKLKAEYPEIYDKCSKSSTSRVLRITKKKKMEV